jgi:hypothetical protein
MADPRPPGASSPADGEPLRASGTGGGVRALETRRTLAQSAHAGSGAGTGSLWRRLLRRLPPAPSHKRRQQPSDDRAESGHHDVAAGAERVARIPRDSPGEAAEAL